MNRLCIIHFYIITNFFIFHYVFVIQHITISVTRMSNRNLRQGEKELALLLRFQTIYMPPIRRLTRTALFISQSQSLHQALVLILVPLYRDLCYHCTI